MQKIIYIKQNQCKKKMAQIIKFPNTPVNQLSNSAKLAMEMETEKNKCEEKFNWLLKCDDWHTVKLYEGDIEMLALFGDVMRLTPLTATRLISKLAELIALKIQPKLYDPLEDNA